MSHPTVLTGFVKQVLSGDTIIIRERACDGPPSSRTIVLSGIACPKVARRPNPNTNVEATADEPFGWAAREFVRKRLIGNEVCYTIENEQSPDRAYGAVFLGKNTASPNVAHMLVSEGLARLRRMGNPDKNPAYAHLISLEGEAKSMKKGMWSESNLGTPRNICWSIENLNQFLEMYSGRPLHGIVEFVRDGNTMQIQLLPIEGDPNNVYYNFMLSLSGIKTPASKIVDGARVQEPFALDAQFFVESRLLQRDVTVILESLNFQTLIGSVLHPNGNIALFLLQDGLARCLEWNLAVVSEQAGGAAAYRAAERNAKEKRIRIWREYKPINDKIAAPAPAGKTKGAIKTEYAGLVVEVGNGDNLMVKCQDGVIRKFFLSSIRPPRPSEIKSQDSDMATQPSRGQGQKERARPLYEVPYLFEAREHLRKRLVGKQVKVFVDYVQPKPADSTLDDRVCATVMIGDSNIAESLVQKGLGSVVRYKGTSDARSRAYDSLLNAEVQASKKAAGIFNLKAAPVHRLTDLSGNSTKCRDFLPSLKRAGMVDAVVEFVSSASRLRLHIPRENCLCTAVASGLICPRSSRRVPNMPEEAGEPFGDEAYNYTREICMQRDVKFEADSIDRVGGVIGWIYLPAEVRITPPKKEKKKRRWRFLKC
uniref:TNase-like domain-containing protein n=1 Tax=Schistocephalus solidus TaxID=70667 RepID=A0A0V0J2F8_SCHSO